LAIVFDVFNIYIPIPFVNTREHPKINPNDFPTPGFPVVMLYTILLFIIVTVVVGYRVAAPNISFITILWLLASANTYTIC